MENRTFHFCSYREFPDLKSFINPGTKNTTELRHLGDISMERGINDLYTLCQVQENIPTLESCTEDLHYK